MGKQRNSAGNGHKYGYNGGHGYGGHGHEYGQDYGDGGGHAHINGHGGGGHHHSEGDGHHHGNGQSNGGHNHGGQHYNVGCHGHGKRKPPLPLYIVTAAASGDTSAMCTLVNHYAGYIATLSMKWLTDERGHEYRVVDEDKQQELTVRLITAILNLKAAA